MRPVVWTWISRRGRCNISIIMNHVSQRFFHIRQKALLSIYVEILWQMATAAPSLRKQTLKRKFTMSQASARKAEAARARPSLGVRLQRRRIVRLQVGETAFVTTHHTLCKESTFFQSLLSDRSQQLPNGAYFVDADPQLFTHILRYLRHGIYPVSFTPSEGHDHATYLGVKRLATDLAIERLAKWIADKQYEAAIECSVTFERIIFLAQWHSPPRSYLSTDLIHFVPDSTGRVWEAKKSFTARPEAFLVEPQRSR